ncbi:hypothetical protein C8R43DRAFT_1139845 [Mycena crocata]|nr:hypothetical protein C8R43DRAFT_1139845 [Mycena crocata]
MPSFPQTNVLSHAERTRLVCSNRTLQALLGETLQCLPHAWAQGNAERGSPSASFTSRRQNPPPSVSTLAASDPSRPRLFLQLESQSTDPYTFSLPTFLSPPLTPLSPTTSITYNVGENIAPELVAEPLPPQSARVWQYPALQSAWRTVILGSSTTLARSFSIATRSPRNRSISNPRRRTESLPFSSTAIVRDLLTTKEPRDAIYAPLEKLPFSSAASSSAVVVDGAELFSVSTAMLVEYGMPAIGRVAFYT